MMSALLVLCLLYAVTCKPKQFLIETREGNEPAPRPHAYSGSGARPGGDYVGLEAFGFPAVEGGAAGDYSAPAEFGAPEEGGAAGDYSAPAEFGAVEYWGTMAPVLVEG